MQMISLSSEIAADADALTSLGARSIGSEKRHLACSCLARLADTVQIPRVLVILATYNGAEWLREQVETVLAQDGVEVSLLIRDDGSTDTTFELLKTLSSEHDRIEVVSSRERLGSASANFFELISLASAEGYDYVSFCDHDDYWLSDKLEKAIALILRFHASGYSSSVIAVWGLDRSMALRQNPKVTFSDYLFEGAGQGCTFVLPMKSFSQVREVVMRHRALLSRIHYHDWAVYAIVRAQGGHWVFDPEPSMYYRQHSANDTGARFTVAGVKKRIGKIFDGWYAAQVIEVSSLVALLGDENGRMWLRLNESSVHIRFSSWVRRIFFVISGGRRSALDRLVQIFAVLLGRL